MTDLQNLRAKLAALEAGEDEDEIAYRPLSAQTRAFAGSSVMSLSEVERRQPLVEPESSVARAVRVCGPLQMVHTREWQQEHILDADISGEEKKRQLRLLDLTVEHTHRVAEAEAEWVAADRVEAMEELREVMYEVSSNDSDEIDTDHDAEWRPLTARIFAAARALSVNHSTQATDAFVEVLNELSNTTTDDDGNPFALTLTEVQMLWDGIRFSHRNADPVHNKHWLSHSVDILRNGHLQSRLSLTNYLAVMRAAAECSHLDERHRRKVQRWSERTMLLFRKRVIKLEDYGIEEPTWFQLNMSGTLDTHTHVPKLPAWRLLEINDRNHKLSSLQYTQLNTSCTY